MQVLAARELDWVDWLSIIGSVASIGAVVWFFVGLLRRLRQASFTEALQEFDLIARRPWHIAMFLLVLLSAIVMVVFPPKSFPASLLVLVPVIGSLLLLASFFLSQNSRLSRNIVLNEMRKAIAQAGKYRNQPCAAIRFDIDLIVAVNDYSYAVGTHIFELVRGTIDAVVAEIHQEGRDAILIGIPEGDEVVLILRGATVDYAADIADEVRRRVKAGLVRIPYYGEAREFVVQKLQNPPLTEEEKEGIGTVSAGVAAYTSGEEALLSNISSAVKESKFRGRNKTVIYNRGGPSIIRGD